MEKLHRKAWLYCNTLDVPKQGQTTETPHIFTLQCIELNSGVVDLATNFPVRRNWTQQNAGCLHGSWLCVSIGAVDVFEQTDV